MIHVINKLKLDEDAITMMKSSQTIVQAKHKFKAVPDAGERTRFIVSFGGVGPAEISLPDIQALLEPDASVVKDSADHTQFKH